jgi:hypothetical protein
VNWGTFKWGDGTYFGSTTYTKELSNTYTTEVDPLKSTSHNTDTTINYASTSIKGTNKYQNYAIGFADNLIKKTSKYLSNTVSFTDGLIKKSSKHLLNTVNYTDSLIKKTNQRLSHNIDYALNLIKASSHNGNYIITYSSNAIKSTTKIISNAVQYTNNLIKLNFYKLLYAVGYNNSISKAISKTFDYAVNYVSSITKWIRYHLSYATTYTNYWRKLYNMQFVYVVSHSNTLNKKAHKVVMNLLDYVFVKNRLFKKDITVVVSYGYNLIKTIIDNIFNSLIFYVPNYLEDDFECSLNVNGKTCVLNYNSATPTSIAININSLDFKSNMKGLSDNTFDMEAMKNSGIKKGDYLTDPDGNVYLVNWNPMKEINCLRAQIQMCTIMIDFQRFQSEVIDSDGVSATPCSYLDIVEDVYCYFNRTGMGVFDSSTGQVGIPHTQRICIGLQYNADTSNIRISDEFTLYNKPYVITDIDYSQMNTSGVDGVLIVYAQILEGGRKC